MEDLTCAGPSSGLPGILEKPRLSGAQGWSRTAAVTDALPERGMMLAAGHQQEGNMGLCGAAFGKLQASDKHQEEENYEEDVIATL